MASFNSVAKDDTCCEAQVTTVTIGSLSSSSEQFRMIRNLSIPANFKLQLKEKKQSRRNAKKITSLNGEILDCKTMRDENNQPSRGPPDRSGHPMTLIDCQPKRRHSERQISRTAAASISSELHTLKAASSASTAGGARSDTNGASLPVSSLSSSLRASDSAFSQSQSTLESSDEADRRSSSSFSRSLNDELIKDSCSTGSTSRIIMINDLGTTCGSSSSSGSTSGKLLISDCKTNQRAKQSTPFESDDVSSAKSVTSEPPDDGFSMIWRNLTFRVPEKRFSKLNTRLQRYRESVWLSDAQNNNDQTMTGCNPAAQVGASNVRVDNDAASGSGLQVASSSVPRKVIFDNLNGCAQSGKLTAILGPSGAGKTTLLNCLTAGLVKGVSGSILIKDCGLGETRRKRLKLCIIPQKDYLFDKLTVMENLLFASRLKNTQEDFEHSKNVQRVTNLLGLQSCLQLKTGKLSGGQYKRVSIAQELLSKPDILILDEPTSGLDSLTCFRTISVLCDLVNMSRAGLIKPLAIIMTIHQPQMKVFNLFHHVYIMNSLGDCIYEGKPEDLIDTVASCCKLLPPPDDLNPASFIIDLASQVYGPEPMAKLIGLQRENFVSLHGAVSSGASSHANEEATSGDTRTTTNITNDDRRAANLKQQHGQLTIFMGDKSKAAPPNPMENNNINDNDSYSKCDNIRIEDQLMVSDCLRRCNNHDRCFWLHTWLLVNRLWVAMWRDPLLATTRITFHLLIPFVFYFIYSQKSGEANACPLVERELDLHTMTSEETLQRLQVQHNELILTFENVSLFFLLLYSFSMCVLAITALSFPLNMQILLKETSNGWYSMSRFVMAKTLADLPMELAMPVISVSMAYYLTGQPGSYMSWRMLTITAVMTLCSLISQTQGLLFGAYFMNNVQAAVFISQASSLPWIMLSGFTTRVIELPALLRWLSFGSIYRLGIESIVAARYGFGMCPCDSDLVDDKPTKLVGISDQLRSVMRYYFEMYADQNQQQAQDLNSSQSPNKTGATSTSSSASSITTLGGAENSSEDILERLASTISRANTYGAEIVTCHDVKPFIMSARGVEEATLPKFILILMIIFVALKILLFFVVRLRAGR